MVEWYGKNVFYLFLDCAETGLDRTLLVKRDSLDRRGLSLPDKELDTLNPNPSNTPPRPFSRPSKHRPTLGRLSECELAPEITSGV